VAEYANEQRSQSRPNAWNRSKRIGRMHPLIDLLYLALDRTDVIVPQAQVFDFLCHLELQRNEIDTITMKFNGLLGS
ncbi:hypothetical protein, partial [Paraburkholderia kururiensis]|uniref:hypothetical protein n=1 Tax=Paraburkholderia kururiensis TaxID=984307 RepID=UPI001F3DB1CC